MTCPDSSIQGGYGGEAEGATKLRPLVLTLELAMRENGAEIVDVPRERRARATPAFMECARTVLRGRVLPVIGGKPGTRMNLSFHLGRSE